MRRSVGVSRRVFALGTLEFRRLSSGSFPIADIYQLYFVLQWVLIPFLHLSRKHAAAYTIASLALCLYIYDGCKGCGVTGGVLDSL